MKSLSLIVFLSTAFLVKGFCQDTIFLRNPSFEKQDSDCVKLPKDWSSFSDNPDKIAGTQPNCFEITKPAQHGKNYVSLCISTKKKSERIGQVFSKGVKLKQGSSYKLSVSVCTIFGLKKDIKIGRKQSQFEFSKGAILELWGINTKTNNEVLLSSTEKAVDFLTWETLEFVLPVIGQDLDGIFFELSYDPEIGKRYNGVVMIDNCSAISPTNLFITVPLGNNESGNGAGFLTEKYSPVGKNRAMQADSLKKTGKIIEIKNPSFEGEIGSGRVPKGWINIGPENESPIDIQPGSFDNVKPANHGETYVGMVCRDNGTQEGIGQMLTEPLKNGNFYLFSIDLCRAPLYVSLSRKTGEVVNYAMPCQLKIYGAKSLSSFNKELLAASPLVYKTEWERYDFVLKPKENDHRFLIFELENRSKATKPENGNILLDNCSQIYELSEQ